MIALIRCLPLGYRQNSCVKLPRHPITSNSLPKRVPCITSTVRHAILSLFNATVEPPSSSRAISHLAHGCVTRSQAPYGPEPWLASSSSSPKNNHHYPRLASSAGVRSLQEPAMAKHNHKAGANARSKTSSDETAPPSTVPSRVPSPELDGDDPPKRPSQAFRFFDLPAELRLRIYEEVLYVPKTLDLGKCCPTDVSHHPISRQPPLPQIP